MSDETDLLRRYATTRDGEAFAELVRRTIGFVHAAALRQCQGNAALAQDVAQLVFTDLALRASRLAGHPALAGWMHTATRFAAMKILREERRRLQRERAAAEREAVDGGSAADWTRLQPVIDEALGELKERDRAAIVLRFFQEKTLAEVGSCLRLTETAARSCVDRALERLRGRLARRGITSTAAALGLALSQQPAVAAPAGLAGAVSGVATAAGAGAGATGGAALIPIFAMKKILLTMALIAVAAELATATVELKKRSALEAGEAQRATVAVTPEARVSLPGDDDPKPSPAAEASTPAALTPAEQAETARLERRLAQLSARPPGVLDARMLPPHAAGTATPEDAIQTVTAALRDHDLATLERLVHFAGDTKENRAAFMGHFSAAVRARYPTPESLMVASIFAEVLRDPPVAQQVLATHAYSGAVTTVTTWTRLTSGAERRDENPLVETPEGWVFPPFPLTGADVPAASLLARFDPVTGEVILHP